MQLTISNSSDRPLYEQIYTQIKGKIMTGELREGEVLPTIRSLAQALKISVITTARAYNDLEKDGFIHTVTGKGSFVAPRNVELFREESRRQVEAKLAQAVDLARQGGIADEEVRAALDVLLGDRI